jgi:hypothetical protein
MDDVNEKKARSASGVSSQSRTVGGDGPALPKKVHKVFAGSLFTKVIFAIAFMVISRTTAKNFFIAVCSTRNRTPS